jgi:hypothetical protein
MLNYLKRLCPSSSVAKLIQNLYSVCVFLASSYHMIGHIFLVYSAHGPHFTSGFLMYSTSMLGTGQLTYWRGFDYKPPLPHLYIPESPSFVT